VLHAHDARSVSVVGDFNDWDPRATPLTRTGDGVWSAVVRLRPGTVRYAYLVDGTEWRADPHAVASREEFGRPTSIAYLVPRHALAQDPRLHKRLDPETAAAVAALVDSASTLGLPAEPLVQKALEGQSKGASGDAIVRAVRELIRDLATARDALGDDVGVDALLLAAAALDAGATPAQLERLRPHRSRESFAGGLAGLVYLMSRGVPAEQSLDLIAAMLNARLSA